MKKISTIVMIFLITLSTFSILATKVKANDELGSSSAPVDYTPIVPDEINGSATALLIEDVVPWSYDSDALALSQLGISYDLKHSWSLPTVNLAEYKFIILASDQPTSTYVNVANNIAKIDDYVSNGGIYVAHACDAGWSWGDWTGYEILPGGVAHQNYWHGGYYTQFIEVVDPSNPVVAGLDSAYFQGWGWSTHGWFTNVPDGTDIVMDTGSGKPTYIVYNYGAGKVLATMQTIEWGYGPYCWTGWHGQFLLNELSYANTYVGVRRFDPLIDGFQFSNDEFTEKIIMSLDEIREEFELSPLSNEIPSTYWVLFELLIRGLISAQKGYCGGMVFTAKQYFENPSRLPLGYSHTHDIPITDATMMDKVIYNQWITQAFGDQYFLKWLLLRLGNAPSGFMPMNNEVQWILQQIDQQRVVELTVFDPSWCSGLDWFLSHVVLAYDHKIIGNNIYLYVYGPNLGNSLGGQIIHLTEDIEGNYEIADGMTNIETFAINRLGSREAPLWGQTWGNVLNYLDELLAHVIEYVMQKATEYTEVFIKWLKDNLKDLWSTLMKVKDRFSDLWNRFVNWVSDNAKDVWSRIVHFKLWSAVELDVYNPEGMHVGLTPTGDLDLDFDAIFLISNEMIYCAIITPDPGDYVVRLMGIEEGTYHLTFASIQGGVIVHEYTVPGTSYIGLTQDFTVSVSPLGEIILDNIPPATLLDIGEPKIIDGLNTYVTSSTPFTLTATDNPGGSGIASTVYEICNGMYDSGWITYVGPFIIPAWLDDGTYDIAYGSTDYAGNVEPTNTTTAILDNTPPLLTIETPAENVALQDGVTFKVSAWDLSAVASVTFSIQCPQGNVISPEFQLMPATLSPDGKWELWFNTSKLPDGFYLFVANGTDVLGNTGVTTVPFSIRNWASIELLPASETNKAGRTMPVKFSLRINATVDSREPFVYNEELTIKVYKKASSGNILLQTSTFGTASTDYRISSVSELYITNFKTLTTPATYVVEIYRKGMLIGSFEFKTVK